MKFVYYRFGSKEKSRKLRNGFNPEKALMLSFAAVFALLVIVQVLLATPSIRTLIVEDVEFEGTPVNSEEYMYKEGEVVLELVNSESNQDLKVLVNGDETADFSNKLIKLTVREGDVVEIDGTGSIVSSEVAVSWCSNNITGDCIGRKIIVLSDIKSLLKVKME
jgi:hypothetical protein